MTNTENFFNVGFTFGIPSKSVVRKHIHLHQRIFQFPRQAQNQLDMVHRNSRMEQEQAGKYKQ